MASASQPAKRHTARPLSAFRQPWTEHLTVVCRWALAAGSVFLDFTGPLSEWRTDFSLGIEDRISTELYHRIAGTRWFVAPSLLADSLRIPFYQERSQLYEVSRREAGGALDIGYAFNSNDELRIGTAQSSLRYSQTLGPRVSGPLSGLRSVSLFQGNSRRAGQSGHSDPWLAGRILGELGRFVAGLTEVIPNVRIATELGAPA